MVADDTLSLVRTALDLPDAYPLNLESRIADVPGWDSFGWVSVIVAIEERTGADFPLDGVDTLVRVGDLAALLKHSRGA